MKLDDFTNALANKYYSSPKIQSKILNEGYISKKDNSTKSRVETAVKQLGLDPTITVNDDEIILENEPAFDAFEYEELMDLVNNISNKIGVECYFDTSGKDYLILSIEEELNESKKLNESMQSWYMYKDPQQGYRLQYDFDEDTQEYIGLPDVSYDKYGAVFYKEIEGSEIDEYEEGFNSLEEAKKWLDEISIKYIDKVAPELDA